MSNKLCGGVTVRSAAASQTQPCFGLLLAATIMACVRNTTHPTPQSQGPQNIFNLTQYDGCTSFFAKSPLAEGLPSQTLSRPRMIPAPLLFVLNLTAMELTLTLLCCSRRLVDTLFVHHHRDLRRSIVVLPSEMAEQCGQSESRTCQQDRVLCHCRPLAEDWSRCKCHRGAVDVGCNSASKVFVICVWLFKFLKLALSATLKLSALFFHLKLSEAALWDGTMAFQARNYRMLP
jgi:hypothetical protein